ncbi:gamma-glutamyl-gamma-aminobutyrate hydrolase family protein [Streptomyces sp. M19]
MPKPLIGISTYLETSARWGVWDLPAALLPAGYHRLAQRAGGLAALLPPDDPAEAEDTVARLDGLVIAGGPDVEPARYAAAPDPAPAPGDRARRVGTGPDRGGVDRRVPLLGICRGMQLLNVARGGTLIQHLDGHTGEPGVFAHHRVTPVAGTLLAEVLPDPVAVPTYHHQAVEKLGDDLVASAFAEDGTVEAVELPDTGDFVLGVQWHPEAGTDERVMRALVEAAGG